MPQATRTWMYRGKIQETPYPLPQCNMVRLSSRSYNFRPDDHVGDLLLEENDKISIFINDTDFYIMVQI